MYGEYGDNTYTKFKSGYTKCHKKVYYAITLFGDVVINKVSSRHIRKWFYQFMEAQLGKFTVVCGGLLNA